MKRFFFTFITCLLFSFAVLAGGNEGVDKSGKSLFDAWDATNDLNIELHVNFDSLEDHRKKEGFMPAKVIQNGEVLNLEVAVRGKFRRRTCAMPPLKLKFKKAGLKAQGFNTHNDFKLVTHCTNDEAGQEALRREKLAYELYNTVNPSASFRTQLINITYVNTADGSTTTSVAILIEDTDELKNRLNTKLCKSCYNLPAGKIANAETVVLFQYMIGNSDYSTRMVRNLKLMKDSNGKITAVPYDFDFSGLVNASYASGMTHYNETKVTDRTLIWEFDATAEFDVAAEQFTQLKDTLMNQVLNFDGLTEASKKEMTKYLKGFFRQLKNKGFNSAK